MADVIPNYSLTIQGLQLEYAQLTLNIQAQGFRIAQSQDEISKIETNIEATKLALVTLADRISGLKGE